MFPLFSHRSPGLALSCLAVCLICAACGDSIEKSEKFQSQVARLDKFNDDLKSAMRTINRLETQNQELTRELGTLKESAGAAAGGAAADAVQALEHRIAVLESQAKRPAAPDPVPAGATPLQVPDAAKAKGGVTATKTGPAKAVQTSQPATVVAKAADSAAPTPTPAPQAGAKAGAKAKAGKSGTAKAATPAGQPKVSAKTRQVASTGASKARPAVPAATWHQVVQTDTLSSIAARYSITPDALLTANNLPKTSRLYVGQSLYIPKKGM